MPRLGQDLGQVRERRPGKALGCLWLGGVMPRLDLCPLPHSPCRLAGCSELLSPLAGSGFIPFSPCEVQADCVSALETTLPHSWSARAHESRARGPGPWPADHKALHPHGFQHVDPLGKRVASGGRGGRVARAELQLRKPHCSLVVS